MRVTVNIKQTAWRMAAALTMSLWLGCHPSGNQERDLGEDPPDLGLAMPDGGGSDGGQVDLGSASDGGDGGTVAPGSLCTATGFCFEHPSRFGISLHDVWAASPTDVWAVGESGALLHFDGTSWSIAKSPTRHTLYGIAGTSRSSILAVGEAGTVIQYNGTSWTTIDLGTSANLYDVTMPSTSEAWIAGEKVLYRRSGSMWQSMTAPYAPTTRTYLHSFDASHLWMTHAGTMQFWNGSAWSVADLDTSASSHAATGMSGKTADAIYVCVPQEPYPLRKWNGTDFVRVMMPDAVRRLALNQCAVESTSAGDVWLFGDAGVGHFDGTTWTLTESSRERTVRSTTSIGGTGFAVGVYGRILTRSGAGWVVQNAGPGSDYTFAGGIRAKDGVEWSVAGGFLLRKTRGGTWQKTAHDKLEVGGILPIDATKAWAVSTSSSADAVLYWNGTRFEAKASSVASFWMNQSWQSPDTGELIFVGKSGIVSYQGGTFSRLVTVGTFGWVQDVDGVAGSDVWAVGVGGAAWRRKLPSGFAPITLGTTADLAAVHVVSSSEIYIGGDQSTLLRLDGSGSRVVALPPLRFGLRNYRIVVGIAGELSSPRGLWVLVSGGEVIELHEGKEPVIHSLHFEGNSIGFTTPNELVVVGSGECIVRKTL